MDVHTQAVLVPGLNDGEVWDRTVRELWERRAFQTEGPWAGKGGVLSLSCVPVGLTAHRDGLPQIPDVDPGFARDWARRWMPEVRRCTRENGGEPWLLLADEWFTRAGLEVPGRGFYSQSWAQLENGVGLVRKFLEHSPALPAPAQGPGLPRPPGAGAHRRQLRPGAEPHPGRG